MIDINRFRGADGLALAQQIIAALRANAVPPTPSNYELWTAHQMGVLPALSREILELVESGNTLTDEITAALFERHIGATRFSLDVIETGESIARELSAVVTTLRTAGKRAGDYASELQDASSGLDRGLDAASLKSVVAQLVATTRDMLAHNLELERQMDVSADQVATLQETLHSVKLEALTDALSGLANRKHFDEALRRQIADAAQNDVPLCLVLCDIDHFKRFNDTWGHPIGDSIIRFIAQALRQNATGARLAARYGGEEFAMLLPATSPAQAHEAVERVRQTVRAQKLTRKSTGESLGVVTLSFGIAALKPGETSASLVERADAYLYRSKRAGRDRITCDDLSALAPAA
ncbi:MAG: diguanylate cyclase [Phycisphaerales bacterium]|nr:diguanylate cyclase [Hyphomonadaceae bacterium]